MGASHPPLDSDAGISWPAVDTAWGGLRRLEPGERRAQQCAAARTGARRPRCGTTSMATDPVGARQIWQGQTEPPRDPSELAMAADLEAEAGIGHGAAVHRAAACLPAGGSRHRARDAAAAARPDSEAAAALTAALARCVTIRGRSCVRSRRRSRWRWPSRADSSTARLLYAELNAPLSLSALDDMRLMTQVELATRFDFKGACRAPLEGLEPHVPWTARLVSLRRDCYQLNADSRVVAANRDLQELLAGEPLPLAPVRRNP